MNVIVCKDCKVSAVLTVRPAPYPGPRCATHHRGKKKAAAARQRELRLGAAYGGLTVAQYEAVKAAQGGRCAVYGCRATGASKALAVDHDHDCEASHGGVVQLCCIRAIICGPHNEWLGRAGNDPRVFWSLAAILTDHPAQKVLRNV